MFLFFNTDLITFKIRCRVFAGNYWLSSLLHLNLLVPVTFFENTALTFSQLEKLIKQELITKASDDFAFKHYLLERAFEGETSQYTDLIDEQYRPFTLFYPNVDSVLVKKLADDQQIELSLHLLAIDADRFKPLLNKLIDTRWNRGLIINLMSMNGSLLEHLPQWCKKDKEIVLSAVRQSGRALMFAHKFLQDDPEVVIKAFTKNDMGRNTLLKCLPQWCKKNKEIVLCAVRQSGTAYKFADESLQNDVDVALTAFQQDDSIIEDISPEMGGNKQFMLEVVKYDGIYLKYASEDLKNDREIVLNAIQDLPITIAYANPKLLKDRIVREAAFLKAAAWSEFYLSRFNEWFQYLDQLYDDNGHLVDKKQIMAVLSREAPRLPGSLLEYLPQWCKKDKEIVLCAMKQSSTAFEFVPDLQDDPEVVRLL